MPKAGKPDKKISSFCQQKTSALHQNASPACGQREIRAAAAHNSSHVIAAAAVNGSLAGEN